MESARILIAMDKYASAVKLKTTLTENGFTVVDLAGDGNECLRKIRVIRPDLAILNYSLNMLNGYEVARIAVEDRICDVILITAEAQQDMTDGISSQSGFVCLPKPLNRYMLVNIINIMMKNRRKILDLEREIEELKSALDTRKEVEKAKGLLMKHLLLTESEAFKRIQKQSMDRGIPMKEIAKAIILAYDV